MTKINIEKIFDLEKITNIQHNSYIISYPSIIDFFASKSNLNQNDFICGTHMVYGWMPKILNLHSTDQFKDATKILNKVREEKSISDEDLEKLKKHVNNSLIGTSKLLHFLLPDKFAIWDSNIYTFIHNQTSTYQVQKILNYRDYLNQLEKLRTNSEFTGFHQSVNKKIGYDVSPLRALELIMFLNSPKRNKKIN